MVGDELKLFLGHQISLVEDHQIGAQKLVFIDFFQRIIVVNRGVVGALGEQCFRIIGKSTCSNSSAIYHRNHAIHRQFGANRRPVKGFYQWFWQRKAGCFDNNVLRTVGECEQFLDRWNEVIGHGAADAAIGELDDVFIWAAFNPAGPQYLAVDPDIAEFVHDKGKAPTFRVFKHMADEGGLSSA